MKRAGSKPWKVVLTASAEADFADIVRWTVEQFGPVQARIYGETLSSAMLALCDGPGAPGVRIRDDIARGIHSLHVTRNGNKGRHFVMFRIGSPRSGPTIEVLRLLHDAMDLVRHLPD